MRLPPDFTDSMARPGQTDRATRTVVTFRIARTVWEALVASILPVLVGVLAFVLRLGRSSDTFSDGHINFYSVDAWYHLRVIDNLARNVPRGLTADPYLQPETSFVTVFDAAAAGLAALIGLGSPSDALVERVATWLPPALGAVTVVLVFILGARLFDRRGGLLAAALTALMPSQFFERTLAGFADPHALEATLAFVTMALLVAALDRRADAGPGRNPWRSVRWSAGAGIALGLYLLSGSSGIFLVLAIGLWVVVQSVLDHAHGRSHFGLTRAVVPAAATALGVVLILGDAVTPRWGATIGMLVLLAAVTGALELVRHALAARLTRLPRIVFPLVVLGLAWFVRAGAQSMVPGVVDMGERLLAAAMAGQPGATQMAAGDMQPLLWVGDSVSLGPAWLSFRAAFLLGLVGLAALVVRSLRRGAPADALVAIWVGITLAATLAQSRFGFYLGPNLALLTGGLMSALVARVVRDRRVGMPDQGPRVRHFRPWPERVTGVAVFVLVLAPNLPLIARGAESDGGQPRRWHAALEWLRANTPDPFGDPDHYYARYDPEARVDPSYTVLSSGTPDAWIVRTARRVPVAGAAERGALGRFFAETDEKAAGRLLRDLDARYVLLDDDLPFRLATEAHGDDTLATMLASADLDRSQFYERYVERREDGTLEPVWIFYSRYYRTMAVRLGVFGGERVEPVHSSWVITYAPLTTDEGEIYREIVESRRFDSYEQAEAHLLELGPGPHRIVGRDPHRSSVPLDGLRAFARRFEAPPDAVEGGGAVLAYEFVGLKGR